MMERLPHTRTAQFKFIPLTIPKFERSTPDILFRMHSRLMIVFNCVRVTAVDAAPSSRRRRHWVKVDKYFDNEVYYIDYYVYEYSTGVAWSTLLQGFADALESFNVIIWSSFCRKIKW